MTAGCGELARPAPVFAGMNTPSDKGPRGERAPQRRSGAPESRQSKETFPARTAPPGEVGLANETRPGLGTRRDEPFPGEPPHAPAEKPGDAGEDNVARHQHSSIEPNDKPLPREPREQGPDSWAHEEEHDTGVSGHLGST